MTDNQTERIAKNKAVVNISVTVNDDNVDADIEAKGMSLPLSVCFWAALNNDELRPSILTALYGYIKDNGHKDLAKQIKKTFSL